MFIIVVVQRSGVSVTDPRGCKEVQPGNGQLKWSYPGRNRDPESTPSSWRSALYFYQRTQTGIAHQKLESLHLPLTLLVSFSWAQIPCKMKGIDILCASPASIETSPSLERRSLVKKGSQSRSPEREGRKAREPSNTNSEQQIRGERPKRSTERRASNADQSVGGMVEKARRSTHRRSCHSISRFSCSAIDQLAIVPYQPSPNPKVVKECPVPNNDTLPSCSSATDATEVVVLRVSLHCQGCAGKVRKHISKMEGVTSFTIDIPKQKVTVMGNVTPLGVLESISKVKNAELWSSFKNNWLKYIIPVMYGQTKLVPIGRVQHNQYLESGRCKAIDSSSAALLSTART